MKEYTLAFLLVTFTVIGNSQTKNFIDQPFAEVSGAADTLIIPNQIFIRIIISEKDSKNKVSVEEQENKMISAFTDLGINTEIDLATSDMISNYRFYFLKQKDILKSKEYILKVADALTASKVFIQLEDLDISNVSIHRVDHSDLESIKNICRAKAIENAKTRAIAMTRPLSQAIGNAIYISDSESSIETQLSGKVSGIIIRGYGSLNMGKYEPSKIEFEKIRVHISVNTKFILK